MKQNGSFLVTLTLAILSGAAIGVMAFGAKNPATPPVVAANPNAPKLTPSNTDSAYDPQSGSGSSDSSNTDAGSYGQPAAQPGESMPDQRNGLPDPR